MFHTRHRAAHDRIVQFAVVATILAMTIHILVDSWWILVE
jgi:hypothetical protein